MAYASQALSLAALELYVHLPSSLLPRDLVAIQIEVPDDFPIEEWPVTRLPSDWNAPFATASTQSLGSEWVESRRSLLLRVPSVVIPDEWNVLINPAHPDLGKLHVRPPRAFTLDARMTKRGH